MFLFSSSAGNLGPAVFLILTGSTKSSTTAILFITVAAGTSGLQMLGSSINQLDLAPRYADVLMGFTNFWGSIGGILAPYFTAVLTVSQLYKDST